MFDMDSSDFDTAFFPMLERIAAPDPAPLHFHMDGRDETTDRTTMYFTAWTAKEAQPDDR